MVASSNSAGFMKRGWATSGVRAALPLLLFLLSAGSAGAHFHEDLVAATHTLRFRWDAGTVLAEEVFEVRNVGSEPFGGRVYAWLPGDAPLTRFAPVGAEPIRNDSGGLVGYDLGAHGLAVTPNATMPFALAWQAPLAPGGSVERRVVYTTEVLEVQAEPPLLLAAAPGRDQGRFADIVRVALPAQGSLEGWQGLVLLSAALLAGAWAWDRWRRRAKP